MFKYTLDEINQLGEKDEKYGFSYWAKSLEEDMPLMFNSMQEIAITEETPTISITAEERVEKQSAKGNLYYRLKKVKVVGASKTPEVASSSSSFEKEVLARLDTLTAMITDLATEQPERPSKVVSDEEEPVDLKDIPF